ncbi:MAG: hypothetical protein IJL02_11515 [Methanobrevibacter sp.]|uniref:hypothetical protein n=1 Tax=Methanobrevibacter sp. TaxID=66852 RepID=UPI0025D9A0F5|nr:hypothetical protein [Methanobrevibacter sp.]MBQ6100474.1 hypothetical protein [Methanobrevibacter sp.]
MSKGFNKQKEYINKLNNDEELFEKEFHNIKRTYPMDDSKKIHNFLKNNPGIILVLNDVKQLMDEYIPYSIFNLTLDEDPIFVPQLQLVVKAPRDKFENGFKEDVRRINSAIDPFLLEFDLSVEFFIFRQLLRDE